MFGASYPNNSACILNAVCTPCCLVSTRTCLVSAALISHRFCRACVLRSISVAFGARCIFCLLSCLCMFWFFLFAVVCLFCSHVLMAVWSSSRAQHCQHSRQFRPDGSNSDQSHGQGGQGSKQASVSTHTHTRAHTHHAHRHTRTHTQNKHHLHKQAHLHTHPHRSFSLFVSLFPCC